MMVAPLYKGHRMPDGPGDGHTGLWFDRFFNQYTYGDPNWQIIKADPNHHIPEGKKAWICKVAGLCGDKDQLKSAAQNQEALCRALGGTVENFRTTWHFATGLGNPHPVENGFAWHPTLGVPYLTGAAVKGLVRAWVEVWMEFDGENDGQKKENRLNKLYRWFGSEAHEPAQRADLRKQGFKPPTVEKDIDTEAGSFIFFDAIPIARVELACDVMTPHYGKWYEEGGEIESVKKEPQRVPADWHSPVPIPFLVAKKARLLFGVAPRPKASPEKMATPEELAEVMEALGKALEFLGVGSKTAVGYGRFGVDEEAKLKKLPMKERLRQEVTKLTESQLATMFGKNFKKTHQNRGGEWGLFVGLVREIHGDTIKSWRVSQNKNMKKTYGKLFGQ